MEKILSHFFEFHIESAPSEINPHLYVSLSKGRYQLSTAKAIYSFEDLYDNFFDAFKAIDLDRFPIKNVLILGLGLGSIPTMLEKNFGKKYNYTAVEIDESVNLSRVKICFATTRIKSRNDLRRCFCLCPPIGKEI